jgi:hypothetical protein
MKLSVNGLKSDAIRHIRSFANAYIGVWCHSGDQAVSSFIFATGVFNSGVRAGHEYKASRSRDVGIRHGLPRLERDAAFHGGMQCVRANAVMIETALLALSRSD